MKIAKKKLEAMPWSYRFLVILGLLFISVILTSYSIYEKQNEQIRKAGTMKTKQEIRSFLESVNPVILQKIDDGQKEICVSLSVPDLTPENCASCN